MAATVMDQGTGHETAHPHQPAHLQGLPIDHRQEHLTVHPQGSLIDPHPIDHRLALLIVLQQEPLVVRQRAHQHQTILLPWDQVEPGVVEAQREVGVAEAEDDN